MDSEVEAETLIKTTIYAVQNPLPLALKIRTRRREREIVSFVA
jgi:hypothetical protein